MRIDVESTAEELPGLGVIADTALRHRPVEHPARVPSAESKRTPGEGQSLPAPTVSDERPPEGVVADDARPVSVPASSESEAFAEANPTVDLERGQVEAHVDAVSRLVPEGLERVTVGVLSECLSSRQSIEIAERLRSGRRLAGTLHQRDGLRDAPVGRRDMSEPFEGRPVSR